MIEGVDQALLALISTILGKMGWDEWGKRKPNGNGNARVVQRLTDVEARLATLEGKIDVDIKQRQQLADTIRDEIRSERENGEREHDKLHSRATANEVAIANLKGRLNG